MAIFIGLNTEKGMIDVDNPREALRNLGLNREDFDVISGLVDKGVTLSDFNAIAGLEVDQKSQLKALGEAAEYTGSLTDVMDDIRVPMDFNMTINNRVAAGAIKFNYLDFQSTTGGSPNKWQSKGADISTSRTSSWSPVGPAGNEDSEIQYGGSVEVGGNVIGMTSLTSIDAPIQKSFRAEVATHYINIKTRNSSGNITTNKFLAMKGIPLVWDTFFMTADFKASVGTGRTDNALGYTATVPITWRVTDADGLKTYVSGDGTTQFPGSIGTGPNINAPASYRVATNEDKQRKVEFFYDPSYVKLLGMPFCGISAWTNVALPNLERLDLELNDLNVIPEFRGDAVYAKSHVTGGAGLAPNLKIITLTGNNLSRAINYLDGNGYDTANAAIAGLAGKQLNRLPLTLEELKANGCFTDTEEIDIRDYKDLRTLQFGSAYQRDTRRYHNHRGTSVKTYDPEISTQTQKISSLFTFVNQIDTSYDPSFGDRLYGANAPVGTTALVKVQFMTDSSGNTYDPTSSGNTNTLVDNKIILLQKQYAAGSSTHIHNLRNQANSALEQIDNSAASGLIKIFAVESGLAGTTFGDTKYDDSGGIANYNISHQRYTSLCGGVYNSPNLVDFRIHQNAITTNQDSFGFDDTDSTTWANSSARAAIPKPRSQFLQRYYSDGYSNRHNVIDMRDITTLRTYWHRVAIVDSRYRGAERSIDSKIDGCTNLEYFNMYYVRNTTGNWSTNGMFTGKSKLYLIDIRWNSAVRFRFKDDAFLGSDALKHFRVAHPNSNNYNNDLLGTSGDANHQGNMFKGKLNLHDIYCYWNWRSSGSLVNPVNDDFSLDLTDNVQLRTIYLRGNDLRGPLPNFSFLNKMYRLDVRKNKWRKDIRYAHPLQTYKIENTGGGMTTDMWKSIGWIPNSDDPITPGRTHGASPVSGDHFVADYLLLSDNTLVNGKQYQIRELGTGSNWSNIGAGGSPYQGQVFTYNGTTEAGSGYVWPWYGSKVTSRGLTGTLPELTCEKLTWFLASINSFTGQVPKWNLPRLYQLWLFNNELSGSIPDFSDCPRLHQVRLQNNRFESYEEGNLSQNLILKELNLSNCRLKAQYGSQLIYDLYENYIANPRGGVTINLLGQNPTVGDGLNENAIVNDDTEGSESTANKLQTLRDAGWTILIDANA